MPTPTSTPASTPSPTSGPSIEIKGDYEIVESKEDIHEAGTVHLLEFQSFLCSHCYSFYAETLPLLKEKYKDRLVITDKMIPLAKEELFIIAVYHLAVEQGKGEQILDALYRARFEEKKNILDISILKEIASSVGIDPEQVNPNIFNEDVLEKVRADYELAASYDFTGTPTIIIDGNLKVKNRSFKNLEEIFDSILAGDGVEIAS